MLIEAASDNFAAQLRQGQELRCGAFVPGNADTQTATVRVGSEHWPPFVVGDVIEGLPRLGQSVFTPAIEAEAVSR